MDQYTSARNKIKAVIESFAQSGIGTNSDWFMHYSQGRIDHSVHQLNRWYRMLPPPPPASVVDFGAAPFVVAEALAWDGYNVTAVDLSPERFDNIEQLSCTVVKADVEHPVSFDHLIDFDAAILSHVFEHLRLDLIGTLTGIRNTLRPGGRLILETPNLLSVKGWLSLLRRRTAYSCAGSVYHEWSKLANLGHMGHVREYSMPEVQELLEGTGWRIVESQYIGDYGGAGLKKHAIRCLQRVRPSLKMNLQIVAQS